MSEGEFDEFIEEAQRELTELNRTCSDSYGIGSYDHWQYEADEGTIAFSSGDRVRLLATVQVVGTTSTRSNTWRWAWANESIPWGQSTAALLVRGFGEEHCVPRLTSPDLNDDEYLGWEMTAVAVKLNRAVGGYRTPRESGGYCYYIFVALKRVDRGAEDQPFLHG